MKKLIAIAVVGTGLVLAPTLASAGERVNDAAMGAIAGGLVFGPVGALAGAGTGYFAGPGIANDLGLRRRHHRRHYRH